MYFYFTLTSVVHTEIWKAFVFIPHEKKIPAKLVKADARGWDVNYRKTSNISHTLADSKIVDNSDVVGASPLGAAPTKLGC